MLTHASCRLSNSLSTSALRVSTRFHRLAWLDDAGPLLLTSLSTSTCTKCRQYTREKGVYNFLHYFSLPQVFYVPICLLLFRGDRNVNIFTLLKKKKKITLQTPVHAVYASNHVKQSTMGHLWCNIRMQTSVLLESFPTGR